MDILYLRCAGLDVHAETVVACMRVFAQHSAFPTTNHPQGLSQESRRVRRARTLDDLNTVAALLRTVDLRPASVGITATLV
jgi:hypothetical protein